MSDKVVTTGLSPELALLRNQLPTSPLEVADSALADELSAAPRVMSGGHAPARSRGAVGRTVGFSWLRTVLRRQPRPSPETRTASPHG